MPFFEQCGEANSKNKGFLSIVLKYQEFFFHHGKIHDVSAVKFYIMCRGVIVGCVDLVVWIYT